MLDKQLKTETISAEAGQDTQLSVQHSQLVTRNQNQNSEFSQTE